MKYYIVAGEASGDLHASNMMRELKKNDPQAEFRCWGGDLMQAQGGEIVKHYKDLAFMGFVDVIKNIRTIFKNIAFCKEDIKNYNPDAVILVDYPGFNLRISDYVKNTLKIKVFYYISPTVWAWKPKRALKVKNTVDKMFVILPFEKDFYKEKFDYDVDFVGHPLLDAIAQRPQQSNSLRQEFKLSDKPIILLMPGSRTREIQDMLPIMAKMVPQFPDYEFVIAGAPSQQEDFYRKFVPQSVKFVSNRTYDLLSIAHAALVTSGTATLETALFNVPEVICYKGDKLSWFIAKNFLVKLDFIGLPNLIMGKEIVKELLQENLNETALKKALEQILQPETRPIALKDYQEMYQKLGGLGASKRVADAIWAGMK